MVRLEMPRRSPLGRGLKPNIPSVSELGVLSLFGVARHCGVRSLLAWASARRTPLSSSLVLLGHKTKPKLHRLERPYPEEV